MSESSHERRHSKGREVMSRRGLKLVHARTVGSDHAWDVPHFVASGDENLQLLFGLQQR